MPKAKRGPVAPKGNMTPMIDVIFQLLIFFLIIAKIVTEEAVRLVVPTVHDPQMVQLPEENRLVVSLFHTDFETVGGKEDMEERKKLRNTNATKAMAMNDGGINRIALGTGGHGDFIGGAGAFQSAKTGYSLGQALIEIRQAREAEGQPCEAVVRAVRAFVYKCEGKDAEASKEMAAAKKIDRRIKMSRQLLEARSTTDMPARVWPNPHDCCSASGQIGQGGQDQPWWMPRSRMDGNMSETSGFLRP